MTFDYNPTRKNIDRAILLAEATGSIGVAVLLRAVREGRIALHISQPENTPSFKAWAKTSAGRPAVALIGDDDGLRRGARAWRGFAYRMCRWASHVMVHAAGAEPKHYHAVIAVAEEVGHALVIETCPASLPSWLAVLVEVPPRPTIVIVPEAGLHPVPEDRGRAH